MSLDLSRYNDAELRAIEAIDAVRDGFRCVRSTDVLEEFERVGLKVVWNDGHKHG